MSIILTEAEAKALLTKGAELLQSRRMRSEFAGRRAGQHPLRPQRSLDKRRAHQPELTVQSAFGKKVGTATIDEFDDASLEKVVRRSEELAQLAPENPEYVGLLGAQTYGNSKGFFESTASVDPDKRAEAVAKSLAQTREKNLAAAGFLEDTRGYSAMMNSKGLFAYYPSTNVNFSLTVRTPDGKGSGYVIRGFSDFDKLDTESATQIAIQKCLGSVDARALEPGKYTVILEPTAAAVLLENIFLQPGCPLRRRRSVVFEQAGR